MKDQLAEEVRELCEKENLDIVTDDYESLTWTGTIRLRCRICGNEFDMNIKQLMRPHPARISKVCQICSAKDKFLAKMNELYGRIPYDFLSEFKGYQEPLTVKCKDCGNVFTAKRARTLIDASSLPAGAHPCRKCTMIRRHANDIKPEPKAKPEAMKPKTDGSLRADAIKKVPENMPEDIIKYDSESAKDAKNEIIEYVKGFCHEDVIIDDEDDLPGITMDIYSTSKKVGFMIDELNAVNEKAVGKRFLIKQTKAAHDIGIHLIHIFTDEWFQRQGIVKEKIKTILGDNDDTVYARKCKVTDISPEDKGKFLDAHHIQGHDMACFRKALEYDGEIVAVMTFVKPRLALGSKTRKIPEGTYELSRFATSRHVVGGFSRLLREMLKEHPEIKTISTFADLRWSDFGNNVYLKNGFVLDHVSSPNYWYFDSALTPQHATRIHRFNFRKQSLEKKFPDHYSDDKTEHQIMDETNYRRVWDCGNLVLKYYVK